MPGPAATIAAKHARARWVGIPLFWLGACGLIASLALWIGGQVPGAAVLLYIAATGLSLATFGTHNDTSLAWMVRAPEAELPPQLVVELREELEADRAGVSGLNPSPKVAWVMTFIAIGLHVWALWRTVGALT